MTDTLFVDVSEHGELVFIQLDGVVDEDNRLTARVGPYQNRTLFLNLIRLSRLNSCGIRDWVGWIQGLEAAGNKVYFVGCSPAVVAQINMIRNFCGSRSSVLSFNAPYFCESCQEEHLILFSPQSMGEVPPTAVCEKCGETLEFDDIPDMYFAFCARHKMLATVEEIAGILLPVLSQLPTAWSRSMFAMT